MTDQSARIEELTGLNSKMSAQNVAERKRVEKRDAIILELREKAGAGPDHLLAKDPHGKAAGTTRKTFAYITFGLGCVLMAADLYLNGGSSLSVLAAFTGSGPTLYYAGRGNHEYQVRRLKDTLRIGPK